MPVSLQNWEIKWLQIKSIFAHLGEVLQAVTYEAV